MTKWILAFTLLAQVAHAEIRETHTMKDVLNEVRSGDLVVFDLDNTIVEPMQTLGSDQWYGHRVKVKGNVEQAIVEFIRVQLVSGVRPVEVSTPLIFQRIQTLGVNIVGLTARPHELMESTTKQLSSIGVHFPMKQLKVEGLGLKKVRFHKGVLFVTPHNNKGSVLKRLLEAGRLHGRRVIFVDDKVKHVKNMESALSDIGVELMAFRYGAADCKVKAFDSCLADYGYSLFLSENILYSDIELARDMEDRAYECKK